MAVGQESFAPSFLTTTLLLTMATATHDPLDSLNHLEASFFQSGYSAGFAHGALHGTFEGRALGKEKGFELWEEVGYYEGVAGLWKLVLDRPQRQEAEGGGGAKGKRALGHLETLIGLIALFPTQNSSTSTANSRPGSPVASAHPAIAMSSPAQDGTASPNPAAQLDSQGKETDIAALLERIRARYKLVCSALGVRPRLTAAAASPSTGGGDGEGEGQSETADQSSISSSGVDKPASRQAAAAKPLEKGQVVVNGQQISSRELLF